MIYYDGIDVLEGIDFKKTANQKSMIFVTIGIFHRKALSLN